jgi:hypothetical protein
MGIIPLFISVLSAGKKMTTKNPITGDEIKTKVTTKEYEEGYDRIFLVKREEIIDKVMADITKDTLNLTDTSTKRVIYNEYDNLFKHPAKSLDAAYERRAMMQGLIVSPLFDENKERIPEGAQLTIGVDHSKDGDTTVYGYYDPATGEYHIQEVIETTWPESEERVDVIGQNGNVGYTITDIDNSNPWCTKVTVEENKD